MPTAKKPSAVRPEAYCYTPRCLRVAGHGGLCTPDQSNPVAEELRKLSRKLLRVANEDGPERDAWSDGIYFAAETLKDRADKLDVATTKRRRG